MQKKKRKCVSVLFITGDLPPLFSGRTKNDFLLIQHCKSEDVIIDVLAPKYFGIKYQKTNGVNVKGIKTPRNFYRVLFPFLTFAFIFLNRSYDIVRFRGFSFEYAVIVFLLMIFVKNVKIIIQPAKYGGDNPLAILKRRGGKFTVSQLMKADSIFCMNELFKREFKEQGYNGKLFLTKNPVRIALFHPVDESSKEKIRIELGLPVDGNIFMTIGILHPRKKQSFITEKFLSSLEDKKFNNAYLVHVGPTSKDLENLNENDEAIKFAKIEENNLKRIINGSSFKNKIFFTGFTKKPHKYLQASNVFVHLSDSEGESNVVNEAMACGVPCILPNSQIYSKQVPDGCAIKVDPNSGKMVHEAFVSYLSKKKDSAEFARNALINIKKNRTPDIVAAEYINLIKESFL